MAMEDADEEDESEESSRLSLPARLSRLAAGSQQEDSGDSEEDSEDSEGEEEDAKLTPTAPAPRQNARQLHRLIYGTGESLTSFSRYLYAACKSPISAAEIILR